MYNIQIFLLCILNSRYSAVTSIIIIKSLIYIIASLLSVSSSSIRSPISFRRFNPSRSRETDPKKLKNLHLKQEEFTERF